MKPTLFLIAFALLGSAGLCVAEQPAPVAPAGASNPAPAAISSPQLADAPTADAAALRANLARIEAELQNDILPFWLQHTRDRKRGGFYGEITNDLTVEEDEPRGALLTSRILWTFSAAYRQYNDPACLEMARWAYDDLLARFWDKEQGGLYWSVKADGKPDDTDKKIYGQAFGIYALAEYHRATGDRAPLDRAIELYRTVESHSHDHAHRGYFEEFNRAWKRQSGSFRGLVSAPGPKSQNTHLHVMEAYANLLRVWPDPELRANLNDLVDVMMTRVLNPANHHLRLFLADDWTPRSDDISFGHDIEFSWLLLETAEVLGDQRSDRADKNHSRGSRPGHAGRRRGRRRRDVVGSRAQGPDEHEQGMVGTGGGGDRLFQCVPTVRRSPVSSGIPAQLGFHRGPRDRPKHGEWYNLLDRDCTVLIA